MISDLEAAKLVNELGPRYAPPDKPALVPSDDAIRVMADFRDGDTFAPVAGAETLYYGLSYEVHADANSYENYFFCRIKPSGDGLVGFATNLKTDGWQEDGDARDIAKRLRKGDALPPSPAVKYMRSTEPDSGWFPLTATDGKSKALAAPSPLWLRQNGNRLLIVQKLPTQSPSRATPFEAAGRYAELWRVP
ncbi:MAG TPA: hypothetical protein VFF06_11550 [Polyangia bacterium]|nr:hypothetical protein [Polyangia bacterium]